MKADESTRKTTSYLGEAASSGPMNHRHTGPLDSSVVPWVVEFRVVGTPHIIKIPPYESVLIGRGDPERNLMPDVDLTPFGGQTHGVSRQHARITVRDNRVAIADLGSVNGSYINGHVLTVNESYRLRDFDRLRLGTLELQVNFVIRPLSHEQTMTGQRYPEIPLLGSGERVLLLDDNADASRLLYRIMSQAGFNVTVTGSLTEAITSIEKQMPSAIVAEMILEDASGMDLVHYVRQREQSLDKGAMPIIALSSARQGMQVSEMRGVGVDIVIGKPLSIDELLSGLGKMVEYFARP